MELHQGDSYEIFLETLQLYFLGIVLWSVEYFLITKMTENLASFETENDLTITKVKRRKADAVDEIFSFKMFPMWKFLVRKGLHIEKPDTFSFKSVAVFREICLMASLIIMNVFLADHYWLLFLVNTLLLNSWTFSHLFKKNLFFRFTNFILFGVRFVLKFVWFVPIVSHLFPIHPLTAVALGIYIPLHPGSDHSMGSIPEKRVIPQYIVFIP